SFADPRGGFGSAASGCRGCDAIARGRTGLILPPPGSIGYGSPYTVGRRAMTRTMAIVPVLLIAFFGLAFRGLTTQDDKKMPPPTLTAKLVDQEAKAKKKAATVEASVTGLEIVDPATVNEV